ncbi:signal peptide peptidase SppA [bacterium]|nr:signal peptide peptidase SppA [bacterium]
MSVLCPSVRDLRFFRLAPWSLLIAAVLTGLPVPLNAAEGEEKAAASEKKEAATAWAEITIKGSYPEGASMPGIFGAAVENLAKIIERLDRAASDDEIAGVLLEIESPTLGWGKLHELRTAIAGVRATGKKVVAVLTDADTQDYLLASACDRIAIPESGTLMILGVRAEVTFYRNLFNLIGVEADMMQVGEYKGAAEPYVRTEMSPQFREEMEAVLDDYFALIVSTIAKDRGLTAEQVKAAIDSGPHVANAAKELGLVDVVGYRDEVNQFLKDEFGAKSLKHDYGKHKVDTDFSGLAGMMKMMNLMMGVEPRHSSSGNAKIAIIHATGVIMTGRSASDLFGGEVVGSDTIIKAVRKAKDDEHVKAIVLRIDSPGGSALASDLMWRELKQCGKPVVASMGNTAASGGYYIAMGAQKVFAEPGTLTGSIGVVGGKFALGGLYEKIGLTTDVISRGENSGALSSLAKFSKSERAAMQKMMNEVYEQFTAKVAETRGLSREDVEKLARGRVYTGKTAKELKLVDEVGTLDDAVAFAKELAGLKDDEKVERVVLPKPTSPFESLFGPLDADARTPAADQVIAAGLKRISPDIAAEFQVGSLLQLLSRERRLTVMPYRVRIR